MRTLGLDVGERRIGLAFANYLTIGTPVVVPAGFLEVHSEEDALAQLSSLVDDEGVSEIVVGLPLRDGQDTAQAKKIRNLAEKLSAAYPSLPFSYWDESLSSYAAEKSLTEAGLKHTKGKKKGRVDAVAATMILQGFLDSRRFYPGV